MAAFLLRSWAKSFSLRDINKMTDGQIEAKFRLLRWQETDGEPVCPECGCDAVYHIRTRHQYRCKRCEHTFSLISGTVFHSSKLPLRSILQLVLLWANAVKGESALQIRRDIGLNHKSSLVILYKLREMLANTRDRSLMNGVFEVDGMHGGGYVRHANRAEDRLEGNAPPTPRYCVVALCQRDHRHNGTKQVRTCVMETESAVGLLPFIFANVALGATIFTDGHAAYDNLAAHYDHQRVIHRRAFLGDDGENINLCETFFARLRRLHVGQIHKLTLRYVAMYAAEIAYRANTYRWQNGRIMDDILGKALRNRPTQTWRGYWRMRPPVDAVPQLQMAA